MVKQRGGENLTLRSTNAPQFVEPQLNYRARMGRAAGAKLNSLAAPYLPNANTQHRSETCANIRWAVSVGNLEDVACALNRITNNTTVDAFNEKYGPNRKSTLRNSVFGKRPVYETVPYFDSGLRFTNDVNQIIETLNNCSAVQKKYLHHKITEKTDRSSPATPTDIIKGRMNGFHDISALAKGLTTEQNEDMFDELKKIRSVLEVVDTFDSFKQMGGSRRSRRYRHKRGTRKH
jgi:hypothetical protein